MASLVSVAALVFVLAVPQLALGADERPDGLEGLRWFRYGLPSDERREPPEGPTRERTSPFGLEVLASELRRGVTERGAGERFDFDVRSTRLLARATFRPARGLLFYGLVGQADLDSPSEDADFDGDFGLAYGGGAGIVLSREQDRYDTTLFLEGRYLQFESEAAAVAFTGAGGDTVRADETFRWREWEARAGVSWRIHTTRPYLGLRYSDAEADARVSSGPAAGELRLRAREHVGGFVGLDVYFSAERRIGLTVEASFPDQVAGQVGLRVWF
ncbi:MAG TPA: hypothetical protein VF406_21160 [Thermodesulfobacteriota bacterium]